MHIDPQTVYQSGCLLGLGEDKCCGTGPHAVTMVTELKVAGAQLETVALFQMVCMLLKGQWYLAMQIFWFYLYQLSG